MSDSDWRDPFAADEAARDRERRRLEREHRRRDREAATRRSLGERVRQERPADTATSPDTASPAPSPTPAPARDSTPAVQASPPSSPQARTARDAGALRRRRLGALLGVLGLAAIVAVAAVLLSRRGDDAPAAVPVKGGKTISLVVPEGLGRAEIAGVAKEAGLRGSYEKATRASKRLDLRRYGAQGAESLEGFLFPATYELFEGAKVEQLVAKQLAAFEEQFGALDMSFARSRNLTPYDVVIIASMIEREIQIPAERELAASVIYNRLEAGTPLGIDATIRYEDENFDEPLVQSRLETDTPYNTRTKAGLPPGPIGNPGLASLEAAAKPAETDFFFYVVKPGTCGEHEFVETEEEFAAASARYDSARDAAGGNAPTEC